MDETRECVGVSSQPPPVQAQPSPLMARDADDDVVEPEVTKDLQRKHTREGVIAPLDFRRERPANDDNRANARRPLPYAESQRREQGRVELPSGARPDQPRHG